MAAGGGRAFAWQAFPPMPTCRVYGTVAHQDGHLLVLGGCGRAGLPLDTAETLDMASHTWLALAPLPTARAGAAAVVLGKQVLVVGGVDEVQSPVAAVEAFLADEGRWERRATLPQAAMGVATVERGEWLIKEHPSGAPTAFIFSSPDLVHYLRDWIGTVLDIPLPPESSLSRLSATCCLLPFLGCEMGVRVQKAPRKMGDPSHSLLLRDSGGCGLMTLIVINSLEWGRGARPWL